MELLKADILKLDRASAPPGGLVKRQPLGPPPGFLMKWSGVALHSKQFPGDADAAGLGPHFGHLCLRVRSHSCSLGRCHLI